MPTMKLDDKHLFYQDVGQNAPIIFGHSFLWDSRLLDPQLTFFSNRYRCIAPDLWGHGQSSDLFDKEYRFLSITQDIANWLDKLDIQECAMVGVGTSGVWATHYALTYPEKVKALVLIDTFVGCETVARQQRYLAMLETIEQLGHVPEPMVRSIIPMYIHEQLIKENHPLAQQFRQALFSLHCNRLQSVVNLGRALFTRESLLERLPELEMPVLILVGENDNPCPPVDSYSMAKYIKNAQLHVIPRSGHCSNIERPDLVNGFLKTFFDDVYPSVK